VFCQCPVAEHQGELSDARANRVFGHLRVSEDQRRGPAGGRESEVADRLELDVVPAGLGADRVLVAVLWECDGEVESCCDSGHGRFGEVVGEGGDEGVASAAVVGAHAAQVAVEFAACQEVGQCPLLDARRPSVSVDLVVTDGVEEVGWDDEPAEA
jgi:hypothetical protein